MSPCCPWKQGSPRAAHQTALRRAKGLLMTEPYLRMRKGRASWNPGSRARRCAPLNSLFTAVPCPPPLLQDKLIHCLVSGLQLSVPYKMFIGITNKETDRLESITIQMCLYNDTEQNCSKAEIGWSNIVASEMLVLEFAKIHSSLWKKSTSQSINDKEWVVHPRENTNKKQMKK